MFVSEKGGRGRVRLARGDSDFDRGFSFFDAIYGFAATLLVTNIVLPPADAWSSVRSLFAHGLGDQLLAFGLSFVVISAFWWSDVKQSRSFTAVGGGVTASSLLTAGLVVLLAFSTQGISDAELSDLPLPTALYAANVAAVAFSQAFTGLVARRTGVIHDSAPARVRLLQTVDSLAVPVYFLASIPIAFAVSADACRISWLGLLIVGPLSARLVGRATGKVKQPERAGPSA